MYRKAIAVENRAVWLGYLGLLPFFAGTTLLLTTNHDSLALTGIQNYAAIILTFVGAMHWGRALERRDPRLITLSVAPSLLAWCSLFMTPAYGLPVLISGFLLLFLFDLRQYRDIVWFQQLRLHLTFAVCGLLVISWMVSF